MGSLFMSMKKGVSRGIFSNEAGLGTGSIAHACADTRKPVKQGMFGIFEVFTDTIVIKILHRQSRCRNFKRYQNRCVSENPRRDDNRPV